jgi:hypothetical protein
MTKCETRKQLSYSRLGTGISQKNGGLNQVLRRAKNEQNDKHGIFIDWDIEGSFFV